jgi:outer membrane cobalamin receptor
MMAAVGTGLAMGGFGCAGQRETSTERYNYLTGSYVPQDVERNGPVTNGKNDVRVIDRSDINQSGGADVTQTLRQLGVH